MNRPFPNDPLKANSGSDPYLFLQLEKEDSHGRLLYYLSNCPPTKARTIGEDLKTLRSYRNDANYDMQKSIDSRQSEFAYKRARLAVERFGALDSKDIEKTVQCIQYLAPYNPARRQR